MKLKVYTAAGGIVMDHAGRVLLIQRDVDRGGGQVHEVRLPKGHVEEGETDEEAAQREVCEETGYCHVAVVADLGTWLSEFIFQGSFVRRTEHYYLMRLTDERPGKPQFDSPEAEESRFQPLWVAGLDEAVGHVTFESEREFLRRAQAAAQAAA